MSLQGDRLALDEQIAYCKKTLADLRSQLGKEARDELVSKSLVFIEIGSNAFINNYLLSDTNTSQLYTPEVFVRVLIDRLSVQLTVSKCLPPLSFSTRSVLLMHHTIILSFKEK
jgi:hypothetical protein